MRISMDGKGRFLDNIFIERLWTQPEIRIEGINQGVWLGDRGASAGWGCRSTTTSDRIRLWVTRRHVWPSSAKPVSMWITPAHRYALLLRYPHARSRDIEKKKKY